MANKIDPDTFSIRVVQLKTNADAFPISRGFPLSNPFSMSGDEKLRDDVCDKYEKYFQEKIDSNDLVFTTELARAVAKAIDNGYIKLGCYCAPKRCHGDTIARFLNSVLN